jgi:hypothetical protein
MLVQELVETVAPGSSVVRKNARTTEFDVR